MSLVGCSGLGKGDRTLGQEELAQLPLHRQLWELGGAVREEGISAETSTGRNLGWVFEPKGSAVPWPVESWGLLALCLGQSGLCS